MFKPLIYTSGMLQNLSPSLLVQITSFKQTFMKLSTDTKWPLYVSPLLSSTNCRQTKIKALWRDKERE